MAAIIHPANQAAPVSEPDFKDKRIAELEAALREYGVHRFGCEYRFDLGPRTCTCGLGKALS